MRRLMQVLGGLVLVGATVAVGFLLGMRKKSPALQGAVRRMNKTVTNPRVMKTAGTAESSTAVVHHVGRTSGTAYATPVDAISTDDGFLVALPYGTRADWLKNVVAAGSATIVKGGETYEVTGAEVVPTAEVATLLPPEQLRLLRAFRVDECLRVRRADAVV
jgi:deazaflavin-dependent oxidoreductase (nitroreductase family)